MLTEILMILKPLLTDKMKNVLVVSASHSMEKSQTSLILNPLINGMENAGAKVETLYLKRLNLNACRADLACWYKHPGKCIHDDKMRLYLEAGQNKDILIFPSLNK